MVYCVESLYTVVVVVVGVVFFFFGVFIVCLFFGAFDGGGCGRRGCRVGTHTKSKNASGSFHSGQDPARGSGQEVFTV